MRRGSISLGDIKCDDCHRTIPYPERYLIIEKEDAKQRLCVDCSLKHGYAHHKKGEHGLTFFIDEPKPLEQ